MLKEKRLVKRALYDLNVNRLVSRQGSIIGIPFLLSTARDKKFHARDKRAIFAGFEPNPTYRGLLIFGSSLKDSTFNRPLSLV
jgi:hypothetical protein